MLNLKKLSILTFYGLQFVMIIFPNLFIRFQIYL